MEFVFTAVHRIRAWLFDFVYNPVYDFTKPKISYCHRLHEKCISKLQLQDSDTILCSGIRMANELLRILRKNKHVDIVGVDACEASLHGACKPL